MYRNNSKDPILSYLLLKYSDRDACLCQIRTAQTYSSGKEDTHAGAPNQERCNSKTSYRIMHDTVTVLPTTSRSTMRTRARQGSTHGFCARRMSETASRCNPSRTTSLLRSIFDGTVQGACTERAYHLGQCRDGSTVGPLASSTNALGALLLVATQRGVPKAVAPAALLISSYFWFETDTELARRFPPCTACRSVQPLQPYQETARTLRAGFTRSSGPKICTLGISSFC